MIPARNSTPVGQPFLAVRWQSQAERRCHPEVPAQFSRAEGPQPPISAAGHERATLAAAACPDSVGDCRRLLFRVLSLLCLSAIVVFALPENLRAQSTATAGDDPRVQQLYAEAKSAESH